MKYFVSIFFALLITTSSLPAIQESVFFDISEMATEGTSFYIPVDGNEWIKSKSVHSNAMGFFTYESEIVTLPGSIEYQRHWKCPYCNRYFPWGSPCTNPDCPSRFRG